MKIFIWGAGHYLDYVLDNLKTSIEILGVIDSNNERQGTYIHNRYPVIAPEKAINIGFDFIVVSVQKDISIEKQCNKMGIPKNKIVFFWRESSSLFKNVRMANMKKIEILEARLDSIPYELKAVPIPIIYSGIECLNKIMKYGMSLCRFGDGEFEIMRGNNRPWFQKLDSKLGQRLLEVIKSEDERIIIAIAQNFYGLDNYEEESADIIRQYMKGSTRKDILDFLSLNREYYDAYVSRPYIMYRDKEVASRTFEVFKQVIKDRNLLIIEGSCGRMGVGNDLLEGARKIKRVACPEKNAFDRYEDILDIAMKESLNNELVLLSIGPTATVLAYDLAQQGRQALDIGQIDNEYDWYLQDTKKRTPIQGKMVAEVNEDMRYQYEYSRTYEEQLIAVVR